MTEDRHGHDDEIAIKNHEVVGSGVNRTISPALVAEQQTRLPDRALLRAKLHDCYELKRQ